MTAIAEASAPTSSGRRFYLSPPLRPVLDPKDSRNVLRRVPISQDAHFKAYRKTQVCFHRNDDQLLCLQPLAFLFGVWEFEILFALPIADWPDPDEVPF
jgi:hypothetical protein